MTEKEINELKCTIRNLRGQIEVYDERLEARTDAVGKLSQTVGSLKVELSTLKYYRYLNVVQNEIAKFDKYAYTCVPKFAYFQSDIDSFLQSYSYEDLQTEKRRLRWLHILHNSNEPLVMDLQKGILESFISDASGNMKGLTYDEFANFVARGYSLISTEIRNLSYNPMLEGRYRPHPTHDKNINLCLNLIMYNVELDVGEMVPRPKKSKAEPSSSQ